MNRGDKMLNDFRPVSIKNKLSSKKVTESQSLLTEVYNEADPKIHQCLHVANYLIIKYDTEIRSDTIVTVKNRRKLKDVSEEFPKELRSTIREIEQQFDITKEQIRSMKKDLKDVGFKQMKAEEQISHLKRTASQIQIQSEKEKLYKNFIKTYQAFNECLNDNLLEMDTKSKSEIHSILKGLDNVIQEYMAKL